LLCPPFVARMSEAISGSDGPAYRFAHAGYIIKFIA
jgi:hypothetical protein